MKEEKVRKPKKRWPEVWSQSRWRYKFYPLRRMG